MHESGSLFGDKRTEGIGPTEQLNDYLKVTSPGLWVTLTALLIMLFGILAWTVFGRLRVTVTLSGTVKEGLLIAEAEDEIAPSLQAGQKVMILDQEEEILDVKRGEDSPCLFYVRTSLPDGEYPVHITLEEIAPASFLFAENGI